MTQERLEINVIRNRETDEVRVLLNLPFDLAEAVYAVLKHHPAEGTHSVMVALGEVFEDGERNLA